MRSLLLTAALVLSLLLVACETAPAQENTAQENTASENEVAAESDGTGTLEIVANGEDFVRQGFVSKDGWAIDFDNVFVTLANVAAYQTDPPYDAQSGDALEGTQVSVEGPLTLDLAEGEADAAPILIGAVEDAPAGQYNALSLEMVPNEEGYTLVLDGTAQKDGETVDFVLSVEDDYTYTCGEYVGDERLGILQPGETATAEATFHFDHIFGDADTPLDDSLNTGALGFDPLAALATNGELVATMSDLEAQLSVEDFATLQETLATLGHVGEGHCYEAEGGYTGHSE